jgi:hypothetical protein
MRSASMDGASMGSHGILPPVSARSTGTTAPVLEQLLQRLDTMHRGGGGGSLLLGPDDAIFVGDNITPLATSASVRGGFAWEPLASTTSITSQFWMGQDLSQVRILPTPFPAEPRSNVTHFDL